MIVSHRYKFIFIKTHKTAGSSMESALGPLCGLQDIITPMESNWNTAIPKNFHDQHLLAKTYAKSRLLRKCIHRHSKLIGSWYYEHMPASRVRELIGEEIWNSYHKFCYERNPWAKVVSYYNWKKNGQNRSMPSFREYVLNKSHRLPLDARLYFDEEQCIVDEVLDYESFQTSFPLLCQRLDIPFTGIIPREKTGIKQEKLGNYQQYYDEETKQKIANLFHREISLMSYQY
jgi:hypothetical protein